VKLYYTKEELIGITSLSESTIEEEIRQGTFPAPRQLSRKRVGYFIEDIMEWAKSRPRSTLPPPPNTGARKPRRPVAPASHQAA
jgi:prophage regulatory protein